MNDLISRQVAIREYQEVCRGINCGECPFLIKVNTEKRSHLITDCKLEAFLHNLPSAEPKEVIPHRNYKYLSDYWCECGWHLGKEGEVKYCSECGRRVNWDG